MPAGTILFSSRAPIGYIAIAQNEVTTNQGFKSVIPNENISTAYMYFLLKNLLPTIEGMASGSTFKEISGAAMKSVPTVMPDADIIRLFSSFCELVFKKNKRFLKQRINVFLHLGIHYFQNLCPANLMFLKSNFKLQSSR